MRASSLPSETMQRIATRVFVASSLAFGLFGIAFFTYGFVTESDGGAGLAAAFALWGISGCVVLVSFALSVAVAGAGSLLEE